MQETPAEDSAEAPLPVLTGPTEREGVPERERAIMRRGAFGGCSLLFVGAVLLPSVLAISRATGGKNVGAVAFAYLLLTAGGLLCGWGFVTAILGWARIGFRAGYLLYALISGALLGLVAYGGVNALLRSAALTR